jgi:hypothetical protein
MGASRVSQDQAAKIASELALKLGLPAMVAKTRKAPECSQECSERNTKLAAAPAANRTAMAAEEADALMLMENISEHSTQNTAAAHSKHTLMRQTPRYGTPLEIIKTINHFTELFCPTLRSSGALTPREIQFLTAGHVFPSFPQNKLCS